MTLKQAFKILEKNKLILSLSGIEQKLGCPSNYLSRSICGSLELPKKWEQPLIDFVEKQFPVDNSIAFGEWLYDTKAFGSGNIVNNEIEGEYSIKELYNRFKNHKK